MQNTRKYNYTWRSHGFLKCFFVSDDVSEDFIQNYVGDDLE